MGSSRSVVDDICPGAVGEGAIAGRGEGDAVGMPGIGPIVIRGAGAGVGDAELVGFGSALGLGELIGIPGMGAIVGAAATGAAQTTVSTAVSQEPVKNNFGLDGNVGILRDVVHRTRNGGFILRAIVSSDARADTGDRGGTPDG